MSNAALAVQSVAQPLDIHPVAGRIGAEIRGIKLSGELDAATVEAIQQALVQYKVIFFREQTHLDDQSQEAFAHLLGEPIAHPTVPVRDGTRFLMELDGTRGQRANSWHTDVTFVDAYPKASILRSVLAPASGGDTVWANTAAAYNDLSVELRALADHLWAVHSNEYDYAARKPDVAVEKLEEYRKVFTSTVYETEHPVVRVHPVSGEKTLLLGHFVKRLKGYSQAESAQLFNLLQGHVTRLENTVRWRWNTGDVAIWDNRATQHYAVDDYGTQERIVRRVTLKGDVPVGVQGQSSKTTKGL
ncbi:MAG: taurine dioxygenase [Pseudomonadales bacterium RIFCSPLOWO2_12_60_38]|uniref:TauD/TfdA dioxygenase family protein n=1 Tax=Pseudomonas TaxID=286 RepID=UPI000358094D|nr:MULTISPECIES: TauD/TfdA family dioxygenase [Pseudomonas]AOS76760.1 taurine dioxygenase [Pseudomonas fluorescens]ETK43174.1 dioxygenase [Pseudomonas fluorescens FH5]MDN5399741.1 TauD/TfdA family dioxygenase [Pseudomonas sp.]MDN5421599.1 TauD/TfdA family dioxygenase [Pseudomonadales bacterium]NLT91196.1 TauD/TfdA family dioxygenase [Pseudomonas lactis]OHC33948.1 MAG: taurine dioxygenase [Pseudomonadales bacterium RIFCSPLOWO2_12_60_38]OHC37809.1 MAG: taurine dioxygenase [Pseudomonadales bact